FGISVTAVEPGYIKTPLYAVDHHTRAIADYERWRARFNRRMGEFDRRAPGPELVARTVSRAVRARKPALRYRVTREATVFSLMRSWLPAPFVEAGLRSGFRLDHDRH